jgi:hypothetical protein
MQDYLKFILVMVSLVIAWGLLSLRGVNLKEYFNTKAGKGILKGIILAMLFAILFLFLSNAKAGTWFNDADVFAGLESTKKSNPMCVEGTPDDKTGSNLGLTLNIYRDNRFSVNGKYTHHSCAFSEDDRSYDALGIELKYQFWSR